MVYTFRVMSSIFLIFLLVSLACFAWVITASRRRAAINEEGPVRRKHTGFMFASLAIVFFVLVGVTSPQDMRKQPVVLNLEPANTQTQGIVTKQVTQTEPIAFTTIDTPDGTLPKGQTKIILPGKNGAEVLTFSVVYTDGQETSKTLLSQSVTLSPTSQVVAVGIAPTLPPPPMR
jgi:hypothetical protein